MFFEKWKEGKPEYFLGAGAVLGFVLAAIGLIYPEREILLSDAIAEVNGNQIQKDEYYRALSGYASDTKSPIDEEVKKRVLNRLIDEELLVQRGLELGYANEDRSIRSKIVSTVIQSILSEQVSKKPNELELRIYFLSNQDKFLNSSRYKILVYAESNEDAAKQLSKAIRDGGSVSSASRVADVPGDFLPLRKLLDYLGSDGVEVLIRLKAGEVSEPILSGGRYLVLKILAIEPGFVPAFSAIKNEVETSYIQEKGNEALREYLDWLRSKSKVTIGDLKD
ncbi:peptidylprolyl isomerase [Leptospira kmetyi]|uniref:peptidylprolyl isomerase n=1 Tax=Leptospira kmetyi TaxID=408139 RepID=UPI0002898EEC|nr:peptidylprolyl isomerase [Leptospira kmetyi]EQA55585.1 PPIC-type PPIASE domain protein [Leptospira kmetyi serovar Malaysia str. Bejo-Iso9]